VGTIDQETLRVRGVRGATTVLENTRAQIQEATLELMTALIQANGITPEAIVMVMFTCTPDLNAGFPSQAVREALPNWDQVPLLDLAQLDIPGSLRQCIRVIVQFYTAGPVQPVYLRGAVTLRPDLIPANSKPLC